MTAACVTCDSAAPSAVELSVWYMRDNHTFVRLRGDVDEILAQARVLGVESSYGMLTRGRFVDKDQRQIRDVGHNVHAKKGFDETELIAWRTAVMADPEAANFLSPERP